MRDKNIDIYRGCVMLYITCFVHLMFWMKFFGFPYKSWFIIGSPASFVVAGAAFSLASPKKYLVYAKKRLYRIVRPYWMYAFVVLSILTLAHFILNADSLPTGKDVLKWTLLSGESRFPFISSHLWYILPYISLSLCAPFLYRLWVWTKIPAGFLVVFFLTTIFLVDQFDVKIVQIRYVLVYGLFYMLGFYYNKIKVSRKEQAAASVLLFVVGLLLYRYGGYGINMQENKFPSNVMFAVFTLFMLVTFKGLLSWACLRLYSFGAGKKIIDIYNKYVYAIYLYQSFSFLILYFVVRKLGISHTELSSWQYTLLLPVFFVYLLFSNAFLGIVMTKIEKFLFERKKRQVLPEQARN